MKRNGIAKTSDKIQIGALTQLPTFFYFNRRRPLLFVLVLLLAAVSAPAQPEIHSLTDVIDGHAVGGVTIDVLG